MNNIWPKQIMDLVYRPDTNDSTKEIVIGRRTAWAATQAEFDALDDPPSPIPVNGRTEREIIEQEIQPRALDPWRRIVAQEIRPRTLEPWRLN